jgi:hypothetical protein
MVDNNFHDQDGRHDEEAQLAQQDRSASQLLDGGRGGGPEEEDSFQAA